MRKILLASTALVAVVGVSAANAEITFSGGHDFEYTSVSDDQADNTTAGENGTTMSCGMLIVWLEGLAWIINPGVRKLSHCVSICWLLRCIRARCGMPLMHTSQRFRLKNRWTPCN